MITYRLWILNLAYIDGDRSRMDVSEYTDHFLLLLSSTCYIGEHVRVDGFGRHLTWNQAATFPYNS